MFSFPIEKQFYNFYCTDIFSVLILRRMLILLYLFSSQRCPSYCWGAPPSELCPEDQAQIKFHKELLIISESSSPHPPPQKACLQQILQEMECKLTNILLCLTINSNLKLLVLTFNELINLRLSPFLPVTLLWTTHLVTNIYTEMFTNLLSIISHIKR